MVQRIRVVWKDTRTHIGAQYIHRNVTIEGYGEGWVVDVEDDENIYKTRRSAKNAIDKALGKEGMKRAAKVRAEEGIIIIGKKSAG